MTTLEIRQELFKKMKSLQVEGFSSMVEFSDEERLAQLEEIERIVEIRYVLTGE